MASSLTEALKQLEATEANLAKAERLVGEAIALIPDGICFGSDPEYDNKCRFIQEIAQHLPAIEKWSPSLGMLELDSIAQWRLDATEISEPESLINLSRAIEEPIRELETYRYKLNRMRRILFRDATIELVREVELDLSKLQQELQGRPSNDKAGEPLWESLRSHLGQIETLLGGRTKCPLGWNILLRHVHFAMVCDFLDIEKADWPSARAELNKILYHEDEPLPVETNDLADLVALKPRGSITTKLRWSSLTKDNFERLIMNLISTEENYESPQWLMHINAPDRGRDLSVFHIMNDSLLGTVRRRIIIQCRHTPSSSVSVEDLSVLREQMSFWGEPRVDILVVATTGRFTSDAVSWIEKNNISDRALRVEMWPESHLELLLSNHPALIAAFSLR